MLKIMKLMILKFSMSPPPKGLCAPSPKKRWSEV